MYDDIKFKKTKRKKEKNIIIEIPPIFFRINWKQLFIKLIILFSFMILLIFTISRIKIQYYKNNEIFENNINTIISATLKYFEKNELPNTVGTSSSLILEELRNKELLSDIKENDKFCNYINSYIIFTKVLDNEYRLKVYLKCPSKDKTLEKIIICNNNICSIKK